MTDGAGDPSHAAIEAVWRLEDQNHLAGSLVHPGQKLRLP